MTLSKKYSSNPRNADTYFNHQTYQQLYQRSINEPLIFWEEIATQMISWQSRWQTVCSGDFHAGNVRWFDGEN